jgi:hypothetical protein
MKGIIVEYDANFCEMFKPIIEEFERFYWLADFQSWPVDFDWSHENEENKRFVEEICLELPLLANTSTQVWRPGTLPKLAPYIHFSEWSYLTGLKCDENDVGRLIAEFFFCKGFLYREYFQLVDLYAEIYIVYVDQWWEIYTNRKQWFDILQDIPNAKIIDSSKWY